MKYRTDTRKTLLTSWENYRQAVQTAPTREQFLIRSGNLLAISRILNQLRHNGDGKDPIKTGEWENEAMKVISQWTQKENDPILQ